MLEKNERRYGAPDDRQARMVQQVGARAARKRWARRQKDRSLHLGLGALGVVGWSVVVPTLVGVGLGLWVYRRWPGAFLWVLAFLVFGVGLGCWNAWHWLMEEQRMVEIEEEAVRNE